MLRNTIAASSLSAAIGYAVSSGGGGEDPTAAPASSAAWGSYEAGPGVHFKKASAPRLYFGAPGTSGRLGVCASQFRTRVKTAQHSSTGGHRHPEHASCHCHLPATDPIASSPLPCFPPRPLVCFVPPSHPPRPSHHHIGWLEWLCCTQRHGRRRGGKPRSGAFLNLPSTPSDISSPRNRTTPNPKSSISHFSWSRDCAHTSTHFPFPLSRVFGCR